MASRLARKFATNKAAETQGILYEEEDYDGPIFQVRLARLNGNHSKYQQRLSELMKPYRRMNTEDIPQHKRDSIITKAFCETCVLPGTWKTYVNGEWVDGIEDPATEKILPATAQNYQLVLDQLDELKDRLLSESMKFDNYRLATLEVESKNS